MDYDRLAYERLLHEHPDAHDAFNTPDQTRERHAKFVSARAISRRAAMPYAEPWFYRLSVDLSKRGGDAMLQAHAAVSEQHRLFMQCEMRRLRQLHLRDTIFMMDVTDTRAPLPPSSTPATPTSALGVWERGVVKAPPPPARYVQVREEAAAARYRPTAEDKRKALESTTDATVRSFFTPYMDETVSDAHLRYAYNSLIIPEQRKASVISAVTEFLRDRDPVDVRRPAAKRIRGNLNPQNLDSLGKFDLPDMAAEYKEARRLAFEEYKPTDPAAPKLWAIPAGDVVEEYSWSEQSYTELIVTRPWPKLRELATRGSWVGMVWLMQYVSKFVATLRTYGDAAREADVRTNGDVRTLLWATLRICQGNGITVSSKDEDAWAWWSSMRYATREQLRLIAEKKTAAGVELDTLRAVQPRIYDPTAGARDYLRIPEDENARPLDEREIWERGMPGVTQARINTSAWVFYASGIPKVLTVVFGAWAVSALTAHLFAPTTLQWAKFLFYFFRDAVDVYKGVRDSVLSSTLLQSTLFAGRSDPRTVRGIAPLYIPMTNEDVAAYRLRDTLSTQITIASARDRDRVVFQLKELDKTFEARVNAALEPWIRLRLAEEGRIPTTITIDEETRRRYLRDERFLASQYQEIESVSVVRHGVRYDIKVGQGLTATEFRALVVDGMAARRSYFENIFSSAAWQRGDDATLKAAMGQAFPGIAVNSTLLPFEFARQALLAIRTDDASAIDQLDGRATFNYDAQLAYYTQLNRQLSDQAGQGPLLFSFYNTSTTRSPVAPGVIFGRRSANVTGEVNVELSRDMGILTASNTTVTPGEAGSTRVAGLLAGIQVREERIKYPPETEAIFRRQAAAEQAAQATRPSTAVERALDTWIPKQGELPVQEVWGLLMLGRTFGDPQNLLGGVKQLRRVNYALFEAPSRIRWYVHSPWAGASHVLFLV
jgi:hypothetical protein